jgi:hypothetical protein
MKFAKELDQDLVPGTHARLFRISEQTLMNAQNGESNTLTTKLGRSTSKLLLVL